MDPRKEELLADLVLLEAPLLLAISVCLPAAVMMNLTNRPAGQ